MWFKSITLINWIYSAWNSFVLLWQYICIIINKHQTVFYVLLNTCCNILNSYHSIPSTSFNCICFTMNNPMEGKRKKKRFLYIPHRFLLFVTLHVHLTSFFIFIESMYLFIFYTNFCILKNTMFCTHFFFFSNGLKLYIKLHLCEVHKL